MAAPAIDGARLLARLDDFASIGATPAGGVNRQALGREDRRARRRLADLARARGFTVLQDAIANLFVRRDGAEHGLPPILIGSHLDSQPTGGRFDGALGTLAAFEALEAMEDAGITTRRPVEVVAFANEEGSRFAPGTMGSLAFRQRSVPPGWLGARDWDGAELGAELAATLTDLQDVAMRPLGTPVAGFLELHIEQGPALEAAGVPIGVVTGVQGTRWMEVTISGQAAHAGTTALVYRRDALATATAILSRLYASIMPDDPAARFTVGRIAAEPGSVNAIPGAVRFSVDLRHPEAVRLDALEHTVRTAVAAGAEAAGCTAVVSRSFAMEPARFSPAMVALVEHAAGRLGLKHRSLVSGAFHDALNIASVAPSAMIFVPCRDGLSHNEAEYVAPEHCVAGAAVLLEATLAAADAA